MSRAEGARLRWGPSLAVQMISLMASGWVITLLVAAAIVMFLPPPAQSAYRLTELSEALKGGSLSVPDGRPLQRQRQADPPPPGEPRLSSGIYRFALARALGVPVSRVRIERYPLADPVRRSLLKALIAGPPRSLGPPGAYAGPIFIPPGGIEPGPEPEKRASAITPGVSTAAEPPPSVAREAGFAQPSGRLLLDRMPPLYGDFTVALQEPSGQWTLVRPTREFFPSPWQQRLILWFVACLAALTPVGYLSARRLAAPIGLFARAAEQLGRDPNAPSIEVFGPAEIGRAATAFNEMQARLKRYVEHRTTAISAMAHDLRTPLARIRFKIEALAPEAKDAISRDIVQMEQMIDAALAFVREARDVRPRELIDLGSALQCVADSAAITGGDVKVSSTGTLVVHADSLGLERMFGNLVDNAVKYGRRARVRLFREGDAAVVEVADSGPGLPPAELERVFEPFYRIEPSRSRQTGGIGLGLAVARSVARAHGGDIVLDNGRRGLVARVRLPLPPEGTPQLARGPGLPEARSVHSLPDPGRPKAASDHRTTAEELG